MPVERIWRPVVGEIVTVKRIPNKGYSRYATFATNNAAGGTALLPLEINQITPIQIKVEKTWFDNETGQRVVGRIMRTAGRGKEMVQAIADAATCDLKGREISKDYDPCKVFFHADEVEVA
jgi:hypothetical protein